jgi:hypothetical protein
MDALSILKMSQANTPIAVEITFIDSRDAKTVRIQGTVKVDDLVPVTQESSDEQALIDAFRARLHHIGEWEREHFPCWSSRITHDLFKLLGPGKSNNLAFTVKEIVLATHFSERAIRQQINRFESHGWIHRGKNKSDKRNSHILPSQKLKDAYWHWLSLHLAK